MKDRQPLTLSPQEAMSLVGQIKGAAAGKAPDRNLHRDHHEGSSLTTLIRGTIVDVGTTGKYRERRDVQISDWSTSQVTRVQATRDRSIWRNGRPVARKEVIFIEIDHANEKATVTSEQKLKGVHIKPKTIFTQDPDAVRNRVASMVKSINDDSDAISAGKLKSFPQLFYDS